MKKKNFLLLGMILLVFAFSACSNNNSEGENTNLNDDVSDIVNFGQPERTPDVNGIIKSINSNEIVVAIVERPGDSNTSDSSGESSTALGVSGGTGMPGSGGNRDASMSDADRVAKMLERSTGQEKIIVPVGIAMSRLVDFESGEREEAIFSDLKAGSIVSVWFNEKGGDKKVAEFVSIK